MTTTACDDQFIEESGGVQQALAPMMPVLTWQPIETAPMDGTLVLAVRAGYLPQTAHYSSELEYTGWITVYEDEDELFSAWVEYCYKYEPTHWMPLPEPPK